MFFRLQRLGIDIFDNYETKKYPAEYFLKKLDALRAEYDELEEEGKRMWKKYRQGIVADIPASGTAAQIFQSGDVPPFDVETALDQTAEDVL